MELTSESTSSSDCETKAFGWAFFFLILATALRLWDAVCLVEGVTCLAVCIDMAFGRPAVVVLHELDPFRTITLYVVAPTFMTTTDQMNLIFVLSRSGVVDRRPFICFLMMAAAMVSIEFMSGMRAFTERPRGALA